MRHGAVCIRQCALLLAVLLTGCATEEAELETGTDVVYVDIVVHPEDAALATRATGYTIEGSEPENNIYDVQVWAFASGAADYASAIGYVERAYAADSPLGSSDLLQMPFKTSDLLSLSSVGYQVDFYAVANVSAVNATTRSALAQGATLTKADLGALLLNGSDFGTSSTVHAVPATGLPMSAIVTNQTIADATGHLIIPSTTVPSIVKQEIPLRRAVSKIQFFVARQNDATLANVQIRSFTIGDQLIGANERLMPSGSGTSLSLSGTPATDYVGGFTYSSTLATADIPAVADPAALDYATWTAANTGSTAADWLNALSTNAASWGLTYLRETDRPLTGTITYSTDGGTTTDIATFTMPDADDFARNHHYVVYAYFTPLGRLRLGVFVLPWESFDNTMSYAEVPTVNLPDDDLMPVDNTYRSKDDASHTVLMRYGVPLQFRFRIESPLNFAWTARFNGMKGNPLAFKFVDSIDPIDPDNWDINDPTTYNLVDRISGHIGEEATLIIVPTGLVWDVSVESTATIEIVARNILGQTMPVTLLTRWTIVQRATE